MKNSDRFSLYFAGFIFGAILVSFVIVRRAVREETAEDSWILHHKVIDLVGADPLPDAVESVMLNGQVFRFGYLPDRENIRERVWLLKFKESYPYVRVVENVASGELSYMAADQIKITLANGVDVADLSPMLDRLELRLRNFNRKRGVVVIDVLGTGIDAIPTTLDAIQPWSKLFVSVEPDMIEFREH